MQESNNDYMNNCNPQNHKLGIGEVRASTSYIICAATWFKDGQKHIHQPRNIDEGIVVCGRRHHNIYLTVADILKKDYKEHTFDDGVQGFLTSDDRFVDRKEGDLVVDLTMGSGSTGVACKNTNRNFIGIEKDEKYYNVAVRRCS